MFVTLAVSTQRLAETLVLLVYIYDECNATALLAQTFLYVNMNEMQSLIGMKISEYRQLRYNK